MIKACSFMLISFGVVLVAMGGFEVYEQQRLISTALPIPATILSVDIESRGKNEYQAVVRFKYKTDAGTRQGQRVYPTDDTGSLAWARDAIEPFEENQQVQAWYDPAHPKDAFLIPQYQFAPYSMVLMGCGMALGFSYLLWSAVRTGRRKARGPAEVEGWFLLEPPDTLPRTARRFLTLALTCSAIGALVFGHYVWHARELLNERSAVPILIWLAISVGLLTFGLVPFVIGRWLDDAVVLINKPAFEFGDRIAVCVQQSVKRPCRVRDMTVELRCAQVVESILKFGTVQPEKIIWKAKETALVNYEAANPQTLRAEFEIEIPYNVAKPDKRIPFRTVSYQWRLHQKTRIRGLPPCPDAFDLKVTPGADSNDEVIVAEISE